MPLIVKQLINAIAMFEIDYVMNWNNAITSVANNPNKRDLSKNLLNEFTSTYYDDKNDYFAMLFQNYTASSINNIYNPDPIE